MKRSLLAGLVVLLAGAAAASVSAAPPRAQLRGFACQRALAPSARALGVVAVMRPLSGTHRMQLRFTLLMAAPRRGAIAVSGGDLGKWRSPPNRTLGREPGDVWSVDKQVIGLQAPYTYRLRVSYRWLGRGGRVLGQVVRTSPACYQPELHPELLVRSIAIGPAPGRPQYRSYVATISNQGATGAGPFEVALSDGSTQTHRVPWLRAHATITGRFIGAACTPASPPTVTVDPQRQTDDYNRADNSMSAGCPASSGS